jgi:hypothetical protein
MAKKPAKKSVKKPQGFNLDDLLKYLGMTTGNLPQGSQSNMVNQYGASANAAGTKAINKLGPKLIREADSWTTGGLGGLGYDLATGKKMSKKQIAGSAGWGLLNYLPVSKIAKLGGPSVKTGRRAIDAAKQLRMLQMLLGGE